MSRRIQMRQGNGQFRRTSLERDFGLRVEVCPQCRGCNPYQRNAEDPFKWDKPVACGHCGQPLGEKVETK